jgi:4'-phosphopantetheinyl transferase
MLENNDAAIATNVVHVCYAVHSPTMSVAERQLREHLEILSAEERRRHAAFRFDIDRIHYLIAHVLLRRTLSRYVGCKPRDLRFGRGRHGKPFLLAPRCSSPVEFNLTHTRGLVACAVSRHSVGLDAEWIEQRLDLQIAPSVLTTLELAELQQTPYAQRRQRLLEYWTMKEAFVKATGRGLYQALDRFWFQLEDGKKPTFNVAVGESYQADQWQFAQLKGVSPGHEMAVAVALPPEVKLTLDVRQFDLSSRSVSARCADAEATP